MKLFIGIKVYDDNDDDQSDYYIGNIIETDEKIMDIYYNFGNYKKLKVEYVKPICTHDKQEFDSMLKEIKYSLIQYNDGIRFSNATNGISVIISKMIDMSVIHGDIDLNKEIISMIDMKVPLKINQR